MRKTLLLSLALLTLGSAAPAGAIDLDLSINAKPRACQRFGHNAYQQLRF